MPYFHLAKALEAAGQSTKARDAFTTALTKGLPPNEQREAQTAITKPNP
jgi:hypothetical protein